MRIGPYNFILFSMLEKRPSKMLSAISVLLIGDLYCLRWCANYSSTIEGMVRRGDPGKPEVREGNGQKPPGESQGMGCGHGTKGKNTFYE